MIDWQTTKAIEDEVEKLLEPIEKADKLRMLIALKTLYTRVGLSMDQVSREILRSLPRTERRAP